MIDQSTMTKSRMKRTKKLSMAALLLGVQTSLYAAGFPAPEIERINERVVVLRGPIQHANSANQGFMINSTVLMGDKGVVLIDPGGTNEVGQFIRQQIGKITRKRITHVINTHPHGDHYLGNVAFPESIVISSEQCRALVDQTGDEWVRLMEQLVGRKFPDTVPISASVVYPALSKTTVTLNGLNVVLWVPLGSHTAGDLMIYLPDDRILVAGDILVNGVVPTMQDGVVKNWISVLAELEKVDANVYVPGHGALMQRDQVRALRNSISRFYSGVRDGYLGGLSESEIRGTLDLSEWEKLERAYVIGRNINRAYLEIEQDLF